MTMIELLDDLPRSDDLADAIGCVRSALASSEESVLHQAEILAFIDDHDDALHRTCLEGHLTGSALVVDAAREKVLVMLHAKLGLWLQPGGHADGEANLARVAFDEATEETGIEGLRVAWPPVDCDIHSIPERPGEPAHLHLDVRFVVLAPPGATAVANHESHGLRWVDLDGLNELAGDASLRRLARVGLAAAQAMGPSA